jgi:3-deoxy-D-manno-octulosonic-acid transferase
MSEPAAEPAAGTAPRAIRIDPNPGLLGSALHLVYDVAWVAAALIGLPWLIYKALSVPGFARMVGERLGIGLPALAPERPRILVHGVSVGEVKVAVALVRALQVAYPAHEIVLSTTTDTGLAVARRLCPSNRVLRFPADLSPVVRRFLGRLRPALVLLVELEIWPNFLRISNRRGIPVVVVNGRITKLSHGQYLGFRRLLPQFNRISLFCAQLPEYAERFQVLGVDPARVIVTGNVKADALPPGRVDPGPELARLLSGGGRPVLVAGSTHDPEEEIVARVWRAAEPRARLVLVPRHPERAREIETRLVALGLGVQSLSALRAGARPDPERVALVDTIGELEAIYGLADLVFVGGSLVPHGGQNMLEPAAQGRAVLFGPHVANFAQEAQLLLSSGAARRVQDEADLARAIRELLADEPERTRMGRAAMLAVAGQRGATQRTLAALAAVVREDRRDARAGSAVAGSVRPG